MKAFRTPADFRAWLEAHHDKAAELIVRCYKSHARGKGVTHPQAVDEALCFGWIDGVRRRVDLDSFSVRFSRRKQKSAWSKVNTKRYRELEAEGRIRPSGQAAFERGTPSQYSFESRPVALKPALEKKLRAHERAWAFYNAQAPWYRRTCSFWIMSAKKEETRLRRLQILIDWAALGKRIPLVPKSPTAPRRGSRG